jgi:hypothetical protein
MNAAAGGNGDDLGQNLRGVPPCQLCSFRQRQLLYGPAGAGLKQLAQLTSTKKGAYRSELVTQLRV